MCNDLYFVIVKYTRVFRASANPYLLFLRSQFHDMSYRYVTDQIKEVFFYVLVASERLYKLQEK